MNKIVYVFKGGRKETLENNSIEAKEFYYGLTRFQENKFNTSIIELDKKNPSIFNIFYIADKILYKISNLPFFSSKFLTFENIKILKNADVVFLVNESIAISSLPYLIFNKSKNYMFAMGIFSRETKNKLINKIQKSIMKVLFKHLEKVIFLGQPEYKQACISFPKLKNKFEFLPFAIDHEFWSESEESVIKDKIIFVGNDQNRNIDLLIEISRKLPDKNFIFVTSLIKENKNLPKNITLINSSWHNSYLTDSELKKLYLQSKLSLVPLKNTIQPSGQSVTLQSMSMGVPVMISETKGFWDIHNFFDEKNIVFIKNNDADEWVNKINNYYDAKEKLDSIAKNSRKTVISNYKIETFYNKLIEIINN